MAKQEDDFDRLMAETERALAAASPKAGPAARQEPARGQVEPGRFEVSLRTSATAGGVAALLVWVAFAATPFLGAFSGAAGAFVATFVIVLVQRITRGRAR
jgi:hypothetical protein